MADRFTFEWRRPRLTVYRAAPPIRWRAMLNRYPGVIVGAAVQLGAMVVGLTWGAPGRLIKKENHG